MRFLSLGLLHVSLENLKDSLGLWGWLGVKTPWEAADVHSWPQDTIEKLLVKEAGDLTEVTEPNVHRIPAEVTTVGSGGNGSLSGEGDSGKMEIAHLNGQHYGTENIQMYKKTNKRKPRFTCWPSKAYFRSKPAYCNLNLALPASQGFSCRMRGSHFMSRNILQNFSSPWSSLWERLCIQSVFLIFLKKFVLKYSWFTMLC